MSTSVTPVRPRTVTDAAPATGAAPRPIRQLSVAGVAGVWAAAAVPMGLLSWVVAPRIADGLSGPAPLVRALILALTAGLAWQFALVLGLVYREQRTLRWSVVREVLWLRAPRDPRSGRRGGRGWLILPALIVASAITNLLVPSLPHPGGRDFGLFLDSNAGHTLLSGAWGWFAILAVQMTLNTALGEKTAVPRLSAPAHEPDVRPVRLACQRRDLRRLSPSRALGDPERPVRRLRPRPPREAAPECAAGDRRPQRADAVLPGPAAGAGAGEPGELGGVPEPNGVAKPIQVSCEAVR